MIVCTIGMSHHLSYNLSADCSEYYIKIKISVFTLVLEAAIIIGYWNISQVACQCISNCYASVCLIIMTYVPDQILLRRDLMM